MTRFAGWLLALQAAAAVADGAAPRQALHQPRPHERALYSQLSGSVDTLPLGSESFNSNGAGPDPGATGDFVDSGLDTGVVGPDDTDGDRFTFNTAPSPAATAESAVPVPTADPDVSGTRFNRPGTGGWGELGGAEVGTDAPSDAPSDRPSLAPSSAPSDRPSLSPSGAPSTAPSDAPSLAPSGTPSDRPSLGPSGAPSSDPDSIFNPDIFSAAPSDQPSLAPSGE